VVYRRRRFQTTDPEGDAMNRATWSSMLAALPLVASLPAIAVAAAEPPHLSVLPPELPWSGTSESLALPADHPWATPFEKSGQVDSPSYDETVAWLGKLATATPQVKLVSLGKSPEGRDLWLVIASAEGAATAAELHRSGKPVLLAQAGIHSGEIDGKDAGLMLLRDLTVTGRLRHLLDRASFLFVPILSVDGHERRSPYGRINQRGPTHTGWRTNARNLNLNRDYAKLDTVELRLLVGALGDFRPDLYLDLHVTDGEDYQHDITYGWNERQTYSPAIGAWLGKVLRPALDRDLMAQGHLPGPLIFGLDSSDFAAGIAGFESSPRFSTGYGDARHLPTVLVENHSLKPFRQRVLGTYVLLQSALEILGEHGQELRSAVAADRARRPAQVPLTWRLPQAPEEQIELHGIEQRVAPSPVSGTLRVQWTGVPRTYRLPYLRPGAPEVVVERPHAYLVPPSWGDVIERLELHGIALQVLPEAVEIEVEMYRLVDPKLAPAPFEGRVPVTAATTVERRRERFPAGTVRVSTDQPLGDLAVVLLEPASPDSFFWWGFFHEVLSRTEYAEGYLMEALAERMLAEDPALAAEFAARLKGDPAFRGDPRARLDWFYQRTPYYDDRYLLYPVAWER
jgi:hypothetical protein